MNTRVWLSHRARRVFLIVHLWLGLVIGLWFSLIGLSGSVLAWRSELSAMELRAKFPIEKPSFNAKMFPLADAIAIGTRPQAERPSVRPQAARADSAQQALNITIPTHRMPYYAVARGNVRRGPVTLIDPYSARVYSNVNTRETRVGTIQQFHQRLIAGARGYVANGFLNLLAIPLVLSGLWLWWPKNVAQLKARVQVKRGASLKRTLYDLHNVMGIYLYGILFVTTLTGAMLVYQHIAADGGLRAFLSEETSAPAARGAQRGGARGQEETPVVEIRGERLTPDSILEIARALRPNYELSRLQFPARTNQAIAVTFQKPFGLSNSETVFLDPYRGQIVNTATRDSGVDARGWTRLLHLGEFGGVLSKLVYTFAGLMPTGLFITGVWMWWNQKRKSLRTKKLSSN